MRAQFVLNVAAWCVQKDYPEQIPQYYNLVAKHSPAVLKENRWAGIKAALAEGGNLMPLLLLVVPQVLAIRNERDPSKRNTLLQVEYGYVKSCWARLNPEKKKEKMAHWLKSQSMPTKELFHSLLQTARVLLEVQQELHVSCEDIILFLFDLELDKEKKLDKIAFFEVMIEETANYPHFAEYCINGLLQGQKFETARSILLTCQGMNAQQTASLEDKIDIQEAKALSVESYDLDQKQKKAAQTLLDDEEFFNALDELELSDTEEN